MFDTLLAARETNSGYRGCTLTGEETFIPISLGENPRPNEWYVGHTHHETIELKQWKACGAQTLLLLDDKIFNQLCQAVTGQDTSKLHISGLSHWSVELTDGERYTSSALLRSPDNRWYCQSSRCKSRNHYKCEHALAAQIIPVQVVLPRKQSAEELEALFADFIDN